ncbi:beta,beta-carotene 15,15'-dioxygenase-like [Anneissia japonica]|uniref:beta,beta-carotene 15,15'-dioxygenase-like n=1 Tax=Anneissia japonica TaxID=1529436 RepID=UPI0014256FB5|nr:beta,beta-carotene 15,15'-dioxygenase-like [Anneissia japonica]
MDFTNFCLLSVVVKEKKQMFSGTRYASRFMSRGCGSMSKYSNKDLLTKSILKDNSTPTQANIEGNLPLWLSGELLRTGPAVFEVGKDQMRHFFDGYAMLLRFTIKEGNVTYQSRFLNSDAYTKAFKQNRIVCSEFGTVSYPDPCKNIFHRFMSKFTVEEMSDNGNVNILPIADELYASSETQNLCKLDLETLKSTEKVNLYSRNNIAVHTQTAHPHIEADGTVYNLGTAFSGRSCYKIVQFDPSNGFEGKHPSHTMQLHSTTVGTEPDTDLVLPTGTSCRAVLKSDGCVHCYSEVLLDTGIELPRINYKEYNGKPYRYAYGISKGFGELLKLDVEDRTAVSWSEEGCFTAEPVFVPKPGANDEDDGVVLSTVLDVREGKLPYLLILDGKTFKEICRAVVPAEKWCLSLHGLFVSKF